MQKNKAVALITGAARRIGAEIACILHENDINVVLHYYQSKNEAEKLCSLLNKKRKNSAVIVRADLSRESQLTSLIKKTEKAWGQLDILINNASCFYQTPIGKINGSTWDDLINTNLKAPFFLSQAAAPLLRKQKGCIINIVDIHADKPMLHHPVYSISKAGLQMVTKSLARELGPDIRVNAVSPGAILWPEGSNTLSPALKKQIIAHTALKRHGDAKAIAKTVLFLATEADYITGQDIPVDGGRSLFL